MSKIEFLNPDWIEGINSTEEEMLKANGKYEVCHTCHGKGKSSAYLGAFTYDDMEEMGEDFRQDYMRGEYDRACDTCKGDRVELVIDRDNNSPEVLDAYDKYQEEESAYRQLVNMEMRGHE